MNYTKKLTDTSVRIGEVRFSFAHVFEPKAGPNGGDPKYSVSIIIPKDDVDTIGVIEDAIKAAMERGKTDKWSGKIPPNCKTPLRDGDEDRPDDDVYADAMFINASSKNHIEVKVLEDRKLADAFDEEDFYSGCYGIAVLNFFPYNASGAKGVAAGLNLVAKTRDGDKLSGGISASVALSGLYD